MTSLFEDTRRESYETETPEPVFAGERLVLDPATGRYGVACEGCDEPLSDGICLPCTYSPAQIAAMRFTPSTNRRARAGRLARG